MYRKLCDIYYIIRHFYLYVLKIDIWMQVVALILFTVLLVISIAKKTELKKALGLIILPVYIWILFSSLVFSRDVTEMFQYNFTPLWTVFAIVGGETKYMREVFLNCIMLIPIGTFYPLLTKKGLKGTILFGCLLSICIEFFQLIFKKGLCETDDVIYNCIGVLIGFAIYRIICIVSKNGRKKDVK